MKLKKWFKNLLVIIPIITFVEVLYLTRDLGLSFALSIVPTMIPATMFSLKSE